MRAPNSNPIAGGTALLAHLSDPGVDVSVMLRRVRADVIRATNQKQVPWDHSSLVGELVLARQ
jgi:uncharacterized caspase-like protein